MIRGLGCLILGEGITRNHERTQDAIGLLGLSFAV